MRRFLFLSLFIAAGLMACENVAEVGTDEPDACTPTCTGRACGSDGCGGSCGECPEGRTCDEATFSCRCMAESREAFCERYGASCGEVQGVDLCGGPLTMDCGTCGLGWECDPLTRACTCSETDEQFCQNRCGRVTEPDTCGEMREVECGDCVEPETCNLDTHRCECLTEATAREFCDRHNWKCGELIAEDRCGQERHEPDCGSCEGEQVCVAGACCTPETDEEICSSKKVSCGTVAVTDRCGQARTVPCGECTSPEECNERFYCSKPGVPFNDTCATPEPVTLDETGYARVTWDTTGAANDAATRYLSGNGPDVVFWLELDEAKDLDVVLTFQETNLPGLLSARTACDDVSTELRAASTREGVASIQLPAVPAGPLYLWVDAMVFLDPDWKKEGPFTLEINATDPQTPPPNDLCAGAVKLSFADGVASIHGDTSWAKDDYASSHVGCVAAPLDGSDLVYSFELEEDSSLSAVAVSASASPDFRVALYLRKECTTSTDELACARRPDQSDRASIDIGRVRAGVYYVVVDGVRGTWGEFDLTITADKPLPDDCGLAEPLVIGADGKASATGDTTTAAGELTASCTQYGRDVVYAVTIDGVWDMEVTVTPQGSWTPAVYLMGDCGNTSTELGCEPSTGDGTPARMTVRHVRGGVYYLVVDGAINSEYGAFALEVSLTVPEDIRHDTCATPVALTLDEQGMATASGDTSFAANDYVGLGACAGASGGDLVYSVFLESPAWLSATVTRNAASTTFHPAVTIRASCEQAVPGDGACATSTGDTPASANAVNLAGGTYYVIVDGLSGTSGAFDLVLQAREPLDNDTCANPRVLSFTQNVAEAASDTTLAENDATPKNPCRGGSNDLVYAVELTEPKRIEATVTPAVPGTFNPAVYIRAACEDELVTEEIACNYNDTGGATTVVTGALEAGTYYIWVDGTGSQNYRGPFTLKVELKPVGPVVNEDCSTAEPIVFDDTGSAVLTGTTAGKRADSAGSCSSNGPDLVYSFQLQSESYVSVRLTRPGSGTYRPAFYVRKDNCESTAKEDEVHCAYVSTATAQPTPLAAQKLPAGMYFVFVDGYNNTSGDFLLEVDSRVPTSCEFARKLAFDTESGVATATGDTLLAANTDEGPPWCNSTRTSQPNLIYAFELAADRKVTVQVTPAAGSALRPTVYLRSPCETAAGQVPGGCAYSSTSGAAVSFTLPRLPQGTYYVFVDSSSSSYKGPFELTVTSEAPAGPVAGDTCATAIDLDFKGGNTVTVEGDTSLALDSGTGTCRNGVMADMVYRLELAGPKKVTATLTRTTNSNMMVYIRDSACDDASPEHEVNCGSVYLMKTATASAKNLPAGKYYIWVDGYGPTGIGPFSLQVDLEDAETEELGESCRAPVWIDARSPVQLTGTTVGRINDGPGGVTCAPFNSAPDVVYAFALDNEKAVTITVKPPDGSTYQPAVYLKKSCASLLASDVLGCASTSTSGGTVTLEVKRAQGPLFLWVDSNSSSGSSSSGPFELTVQLSDVQGIPANDRCSGALVLQMKGASLPGDTSQATADYGWGPFSGACGTNAQAAAADLVYSYAPAENGPVKVTVTPSSSWAASIYVTTVCGDDLSCVAADISSTGSGNAKSVTFDGQAGTTYYIVVDGMLGSAVGAFNVKVE